MKSILIAAVVSMLSAAAFAAELDHHKSRQWVNGQLVEVNRQISEVGDFKEVVCVTTPGASKDCAEVSKKITGAELQCLRAGMKTAKLQNGEVLRASSSLKVSPASFQALPCEQGSTKT